MVYEKTLSAGINRKNRRVTGEDFALIRTITGGEQAITGRSDSARRTRAGASKTGFAGGIAGAWEVAQKG